MGWSLIKIMGGGNLDIFFVGLVKIKICFIGLLVEFFLIKGSNLFVLLIKGF